MYSNPSPPPPATAVPSFTVVEAATALSSVALINAKRERGNQCDVRVVV